jgi:hypothetical protein
MRPQARPRTEKTDFGREHETLDGEQINRHTRLPENSAFSPLMRQTRRLLQRFEAPRPTRSRMTMAGSRSPGSRVTASDHLPRTDRPSGIKWSSARRLQLRGQLRLCSRERTHRIPLNSSCGHYRRKHWIALTSESRRGVRSAFVEFASVSLASRDCARSLQFWLSES